jgi:hypothetical protein
MTISQVVATLLLAGILFGALIHRALAGRRRLTVMMHNSSWRPLEQGPSGVPSALKDLTITSLGHSRNVVACFRSSTEGGERYLFDYTYETGFGDRRRRYEYTILAARLSVDKSYLLLTKNESLAAAALRPGFIDHRWKGWSVVTAESTIAAAGIIRLKNHLDEQPVERTIEFIPQWLILYEPGVVTPERAQALEAAAESFIRSSFGVST